MREGESASKWKATESVVVHTFKPALGGRGGQIPEFRTNLVYGASSSAAVSPPSQEPEGPLKPYCPSLQQPDSSLASTQTPVFIFFAKIYLLSCVWVVLHACMHVRPSVHHISVLSEARSDPLDFS